MLLPPVCHLTFTNTNWNIAQTITVTAEDANIANETVQITNTLSALHMLL